MRDTFVFIGILLAGAAGVQAQTMYGVGNFGTFSNQSLYTIDPSTGGATLVGATGLDQIADIAYDGATDQLFALTRNNALYMLSRQTGAATLIASTPGTIPEGSLALRRSDRVLFASSGDTLASVSLMTAALANIGFTPPNAATSDISGMAFSNAGQLFAYAKNGTLEDSLLIVNPATGAGTLIGLTGIMSSSSVGGLSFNESSGALFLSDGLSLYNLNTATGTATIIGSHGIAGMSGIAFIPTPGAAGLLVIASLAMSRRRRHAAR